MSEITTTSGDQVDLRVKLLATVSGAVLLAAICGSQPALASGDDADRPTIWIELGGEFTQLENGQEAYLPPFVLSTSRLPFIVGSPADVEKNAPTSWDGNAKISFEPAGIDWNFSVAIQYGRSTSTKSLKQRTAQRTPTNLYFVEYNAYQNLSAKNTVSHMVLDFSAGKDVGLGMFGSGGNSVVAFGVRYAQFDSRSSAGMRYQPTNVSAYHPFHQFYASFTAARKFIGFGPSLSWDASANLIGNSSAGNISVDWGVNGAILFGRQLTAIHHQTTNVALSHPYNTVVKHSIYQHSASPNRSKEAVVPNFGGFAGVSWRYPNAKISFGYRADVFFGAVDGGIDGRKTYDRGFYGPFASISVGIGD